MITTWSLLEDGSADVIWKNTPMHMMDTEEIRAAIEEIILDGYSDDYDELLNIFAREIRRRKKLQLIRQLHNFKKK